MILIYATLDAEVIFMARFVGTLSILAGVALVAIMWLSPSDRTLLVAVATPIFFLMGFVFLLPVK